MKTHHKKSKRVKLSLKYNIQKRVREHKRRLKKEAKKLGSKKVSKDPGIPNSWPFKAEMLQEMERKKEAREKEMAKRHLAAKQKAKKDHKELEADRRKAHHEREAARREKRAAETEAWQKGALRRTLSEADVILEVLDARDPLGCRCVALEAWAQEKGKRIIFVITKADLVTADVAARWLLLLGRAGPTIAVQAEAGRDGVRGLLALLGHAQESAAAGFTAATAVGVVGYAGVGKRALCKAIRQEMKVPVSWLLEACRLQPVPSFSPDAASSLHSAVRAAVPRGAATATSTAAVKASGGGGAAASGATEMVVLVQHLLTRTTPQALMRRFRLPAFDSAEAFLAAFAKDRDMKTKKGKVPPPENIAKRVITELPALPGCFCAPPEAPPDTSAALWQAHGDKRPNLERVMQEQVEVLKARGSSGPAVSALSISSAGAGPPVDLSAAFDNEDEEDDLGQCVDAGEEDNEDDDDMDGEDDEEEEELEGEEEEEMSEEDMEGDD